MIMHETPDNYSTDLEEIFDEVTVATTVATTTTTTTPSTSTTSTSTTSTTTTATTTTITTTAMIIPMAEGPKSPTDGLLQFAHLNVSSAPILLAKTVVEEIIMPYIGNPCEPPFHTPSGFIVQTILDLVDLAFKKPIFCNDGSWQYYTEREKRRKIEKKIIDDIFG